MISNFYTLRALASEWSARFAGYHVTSAYTQTAATLTMGLEHGSRPEEGALRFALAPPLRHAVALEEPARARKNTTRVFDGVVGGQIEHITIADEDRVLSVFLADGRHVDVHLYGARANAYLVSADGRVADVFLGRGARPGDRAPAPRPAAMPATLSFEGTEEAVPAGLQGGAEPPAPDARSLNRGLPLFDRHLVSELMYRAAESAHAEPEPGPRYNAAYRALLDELMGGTEGLVYLTADGPLCSVARLTHLGEPEAVHAQVNPAVRWVLQRRFSIRALSDARGPVLRALETALSRAEKALDAVRREVESPLRTDEYERTGHILMASAHHPPPVDSPLEVADPFEGGVVRVRVQPGATMAENAERYYRKAREAGQRRRSAEQRLSQVQWDVERLRSLVAAASAVSSVAEWRAFAAEQATALGGIRSGAPSASGPSFRRFPLAGGYEVLVGRNARQNETLTFEVARKNDLWLHARGAPGSHAVLRRPGREPVPDPVIEAAASVAAYYSKLRGSALVPVSYCERKYVRKLKGAPPGTVTMEREEVVLVEPALPRLPASTPSDPRATAGGDRP